MSINGCTVFHFFNKALFVKQFNDGWEVLYCKMGNICFNNFFPIISFLCDR